MSEQMSPLKVDQQDGASTGAQARSIEVTAIFDTTVLAVRHLDNPRAGTIAKSTWLLLAVAAGTVAAGVLYAVGGQGGFGGLMLALGMGTGVFALRRLLDERQSPDFILGDVAEADLPIVHEALPTGAFPLVRSTGDDYEVLVTSAMEGDLSVGADRYPISTLIAEKRVQPSGLYPGAYRVPIPQGGRAFVSLGAHSFLVASVASAQRLATPLFGSLRGSTQIFTGLSFAAHVALLAIVFAAPPDAKALGIDVFGMNNTFVNYATKAQKKAQEDVPLWLKNAKASDQHKKDGLAGKRHVDDEGRMGDEKSAKTRRHFVIKGDAKTPELARELARRTARDSGIMKVLNGARGGSLHSIFGKADAIGADAMDAMGGLLGDDAGDDYGIGGLGLTGPGRGGGNIGDGLGTVGLGRYGTVGRGTDPNGKYGAGRGKLRPRRSRVPTVGAGIARLKGALDKRIVRRIVRNHIQEVRYCYQRELQSSPKLGGRLVVKFTIGGQGRVLFSRVQSSTLGNRVVERCVTQAVRRWKFPRPQGGGIVIVSYPFSMHAAGR
ncbi:MAG: TonB family protein [Deltaproteobacteria bacterium]|nr:TonB family protein [Deltaproteobacteria bacterium]